MGSPIPRPPKNPSPFPHVPGRKAGFVYVRSRAVESRVDGLRGSLPKSTTHFPSPITDNPATPRQRRPAHSNDDGWTIRLPEVGHPGFPRGFHAILTLAPLPASTIETRQEPRDRVGARSRRRSPAWRFRSLLPPPFLPLPPPGRPTPGPRPSGPRRCAAGRSVFLRHICHTIHLLVLRMWRSPAFTVASTMVGDSAWERGRNPGSPRLTLHTPYDRIVRRVAEVLMAGIPVERHTMASAGGRQARTPLPGTMRGRHDPRH
jgi:hypothetical protein